MSVVHTWRHTFLNCLSNTSVLNEPAESCVSHRILPAIIKMCLQKATF